MTVGVILVIAIACVCVGVGLLFVVKGEEEKRTKGVAVVSNRDLSVLDEKLHGLLRVNPQLPALPHLSEEYEGWFREVFKRVESGSLQRTREKELQLIRQVNELYDQYLRYAKTSAEIQKTGLEMQHSAHVHELRKEHETEKLTLEIEEMRDKRDQLKEQATRRKNPPMPQKLEDSEEKFFAKWRYLQEQRKRRLSECKGDKDCEDTTNRYFDNEEEKLKEGR